MSDSLTILGEEYTGVTGIKATATGGGTLTYIRPDGSKSITENGTGIDVAAYATVNVSVSPNLQTKAASPSESTQAITADSGYDGLGEVDVAAIPSTYVGSAIDTLYSSDVDFEESERLVYGNAGYYPNGFDYEVAAQTLPTSASATSSGTTKATIGRSTSDQYINIPKGYNTALANYKVSAVQNGTAGTPTATKGTVSNHAVSVTPSVTNTTGYITGSTKTGTAVSVSASELVSGTLTINSSGTEDVTNYASASVAAGSATASATKGTVSNHSVSVTPTVTRTAGYVTAGSADGTAVTVSASELVSGSETKTANGTYDVTNLAEVVVNVSGTSKNAQTAQSTTRSTSTSGTSVISLTCSKAGTYDVYWTTFRSSTSGTWGSRLYIGGTAYETMQTGSWSNHVQNRHVSNVSIAANQTVAVYVQSRGSNYYGYVGTLTIIEA